MERAAALIGAPVSMQMLESSVADYEEEVTELVAGDDDLAGYVGRLEAMSGDDDDNDDENVVESTAPDAAVEQFVEDVERYLRDQGRD